MSNGNPFELITKPFQDVVGSTGDAVSGVIESTGGAISDVTKPLLDTVNNLNPLNMDPSTMIIIGGVLVLILLLKWFLMYIILKKINLHNFQSSVYGGGVTFSS